MTDDTTTAREDALVKTMVEAIVSLHGRFAPEMPELVVDAALKAATVLVLQTGAKLGDAAELFEDFAAGLRSDADASLRGTVQ